MTTTDDTPTPSDQQDASASDASSDASTADPEQTSTTEYTEPRPPEEWGPAHVPDPIEPLMGDAEDLTDRQVRRIITAEADLVPELIDIVRSEYLWDDAAPGDGWAPIQAARLLGTIGDERALEPLYETLARTAPDTLVDTAITRAIQSFGDDAIDPGVRVLKRLGESFREDLACVIAGIDTDREVAFQILVKHFVQNPHLGAMNLAEFGDPRGIDAIKPVLERYMVAAVDDPDEADVILELADAIESLGGELSPAHKSDVEDLRDKRNWGKDLIQDIKEGNDDPDHAHPDTHVNERDIGRNDPCWCGSGAKYKHCHLDEDRRN